MKSAARDTRTRTRKPDRAGKSAGKYFTGLKVIDLENSAPIGLWKSIKRNAPFPLLVAITISISCVADLVLHSKIIWSAAGCAMIAGFFSIYSGIDKPDHMSVGDSWAKSSVVIG